MRKVYILSSNGKNVDVGFQKGSEKSFEDTDYVSLDEEKEDISARRGIVDCWKKWKLQVLPPTDKRRKLHFSDVIPFSLGRSWSTLVSQTAVEKIQPYTQNECVFLPVELQGAPEPYFAMYIVNVVDALDEECNPPSAL